MAMRFQKCLMLLFSPPVHDTEWLDSNNLSLIYSTNMYQTWNMCQALYKTWIYKDESHYPILKSLQSSRTGKQPENYSMTSLLFPNGPGMCRSFAHLIPSAWSALSKLCKYLYSFNKTHSEKSYLYPCSVTSLWVIIFTSLWSYFSSFFFKALSTKGSILDIMFFMMWHNRKYIASLIRHFCQNKRQNTWIQSNI